VRLRLIARGQDDAQADDHGPPAEARIVALFDRRKERVGIGMQDLCLASCEHMFACLG
jgi:hypothetical protein